MTDARYRQLVDIAGPVSRETFDALERYESALRRWNQRINLIAAGEEARIWSRHILDSVQLGPLGRDARIWADLGSGGGLPGAVVALLLKDAGRGHVHLVESNRKKAAFLVSFLNSEKAPATVHARRIDQIVATLDPPDIVTARALAPLQRLFEWTRPWLGSGSRGLFHKGRGYGAEIAESRRIWRFDVVRHDSQCETGSVILEISNLRRRAWPESPTERDGAES